MARGGIHATASRAISIWNVAPLNLGDCQGMTVIAPHPDDETLGMGATVAMLCAAGVDVQVVTVSDGGAAYPGRSDAGRAELEALRKENGTKVPGFFGRA